jgi:hypothetical protein
MAKSALLALACAGCATTGNEFRESYPKSVARQNAEAALPAAAAKALTTPAHVPARFGIDQSGRSGVLEKVSFTEQNFRYTFRLVKDADDTRHYSKDSWPLPAEEYPQVIRSVYTDALDAVGAGGGKVVESKCDGSTFLIRYEATIRGKPATGTIRGWVGPEDVNAHQPPLTEPHLDVISVDLREETGR